MASIVQNRSKLKEFLASISTIKGDLSNITAPPFVLATKSAVEFPATWAEHPSILTAPARESDPQKRALLVLKWYLASLKRQQYSGGSEEEGVKKPLNAFLGELFIAQFEDESGVTKLVSEQVSHHPPVTACHLWNEKHSVRAEGYTRQEVTMSRSFSITIHQIGHAILHLDTHDESYLVTLPTLTVKGLLSGTPYPELTGTTYITSSTCYTSRIEYSGKGWFSGKKNSFNASLYKTTSPSSPLYTVDGQWNSTFTFHDVSSGTDIEEFDTNAIPPSPMIINAVEDQDPWESRRAWNGVISALQRGDMKETASEKSKVEEAQRKMRRDREEKGEVWEQALFRKEEGDEVFEMLAKGIRDEMGGTNGNASGKRKESTGGGGGGGFLSSFGHHRRESSDVDRRASGEHRRESGSGGGGGGGGGSENRRTSASAGAGNAANSTESQGDLRKDQTVGVWKFDLEKAKDLEKPYHGGLTPLGEKNVGG